MFLSLLRRYTRDLDLALCCTDQPNPTHPNPPKTHHPPKKTDPNLLDTIAAYDGTPDFLRSLTLDADALTKAVIGTMGDIDSYQLPDAKGYSQFSRWEGGLVEEGHDWWGEGWEEWLPVCRVSAVC